MALSQVAVAQDVVRLSIPDCEGAAASEIIKLVSLELAPQVAIALDDAEPVQLTATLRCTDGRAVISVQDARRAEPLQLVLPLADTRREARPRLLALAIAELIATSRLEPGAAPPPPPPPPEPPPPEEPETPERPLSIGIGAGVVRAFEPVLWSPSLQLAAAYSFGSFELQADLALDWTSGSTSLAELGATAISLNLAPGLRVIAGQLAWHIGVGLRTGVGWLTAEPRSDDFTGKTLSGVFLTPLVWTALRLHLTQRVYLRLALELGYIIKNVIGQTREGDEKTALFELRGFRAGSWLGAGISF